MQGEARVDALYVLSVSKRKGRDLSGMMGLEPVLVPEAVEFGMSSAGESCLMESSRDKGGHQQRPCGTKGRCWNAFSIERPPPTWWLWVRARMECSVSRDRSAQRTDSLKREYHCLSLRERRSLFLGAGLRRFRWVQCALRSTRRLASIVGVPCTWFRHSRGVSTQRGMWWMRP